MSGKTGRAKAGKYRGVVGIFAAVLMCIFFQKSVPVRAAGVSGYIFPESAERYMSVEELNGLPLQLINYGKNEIYARHGRRFRSQELQAYFDGQSWYSGSISPDEFDENSLNEYERINAHMINDFEHQYNAEGYKLDQDGYSYEAVYAYLTQAEENTSGGENDGFEEDGSVDFGAADGASNTEDTVLEDGTVQHKSLYGTVTFKLEYQDGGQSLYGVIRAEDISGAVLWERSTDSYMCAGYAQVTDLGIHGNRYYYEEGGTIVAIRIEDGAVLWKSVQALGAPRCCFGEGDMIYLCGYYGPDFVALDKGGQVVQRINSLDTDFAYTTAIRYEDGIVYVTKDGSESGQTAKTFAVDVSWMETDGKTDENGKETEIEEENKDTEENGTKEELLTEDNVKTEEEQKTESKQEETVTYDDWIRLNMVPSIGICDTGEFSSIVSSEDLGGWFEQSGILTRYETDMDEDGDTESLVIYLEQEESERSGLPYTWLHLTLLEGEGRGIQQMQDLRCTGFSGMETDMQLFTFKQGEKTYFALQKFTRFNGVGETMAVFHVADGKIQMDCILSDPGYTSGVALQKIETNGSEDGLYSDSDYENGEMLYDYEYDGRDELLNCWQNPKYGEAFNEQIQPYGLEAAVSETMFESKMWRLKEENLTELCRIYATSDGMGMTTDGTWVYKYTYNISTDTTQNFLFDR